MQSPAEKVRAAIIEPMQRFYGGTAMNAYQIEAFVEDLGRYSQELLDAAWKQVRRTCKSRPNVAHFIAAIEEIKPTAPAPAASPRKGSSHCQWNWALAEQVMRSPVGQFALREGVGQGVWMAAWRDGIGDLTERDVSRMKFAWLEGVGRLVSWPDKSSPVYQRLQGLYEAIVDKERQLVEQYGKG